MKWDKYKNNDGSYRLEIESEWSELTADYNEVIIEYRNLTIPGFRSGKVPRSIIEKRFGKEIVEELSLRMIQRLGREAVMETGMDLLGTVEAENISCVKGQSFRAHIHFFAVPDIKLPELTRLTSGSGGKDSRDEISLQLLDSVNMDIPDRIIREELTLDGIEKTIPESSNWKSAFNRIKLILILKSIARQEGIVVDEKDVNLRISEKAEEFGTTKKALIKELSIGDGMRRLKDMILAESTLDYLVERNQ